MLTFLLKVSICYGDIYSHAKERDAGTGVASEVLWSKAIIFRMAEK
ncbi:TPA: hypothetical protein ACLFMC_003585 [Salmonella enterica subsp. diarizonae serovar 61:l,v:z35]